MASQSSALPPRLICRPQLIRHVSFIHTSHERFMLLACSCQQRHDMQAAHAGTGRCRHQVIGGRNAGARFECSPKWTRGCCTRCGIYQASRGAAARGRAVACNPPQQAQHSIQPRAHNRDRGPPPGGRPAPPPPPLPLPLPPAWGAPASLCKPARKSSSSCEYSSRCRLKWPQC